jgi:phosphatidate cytidylyltransferase
MAAASRRRTRRTSRRNRASDLGARVWIAIPAALYAIAIIAAGGAIFAAGILVLGFVCLHELFRMFATACGRCGWRASSG